METYQYYSFKEVWWSTLSKKHVDKCVSNIFLSEIALG
jgi:hypothetical protein